MANSKFNPLTYSTVADLHASKWHLPFSPEIQAISHLTADLIHQFNQLAPSQRAEREALQQQILHPDSGHCFIQQPFRVEYGQHTIVGDGCFFNYNTTILDTAPVTFGKGVLVGPNCQFITVGHPVDDPEMRAGGWEQAKPITIGNNVWFGAGVTVLPGIEIGANCVIGAGTVVTKSVPANCVVVGNPGRVLREIDPTRAERKDLPEGIPVDALGQIDKGDLSGAFS